MARESERLEREAEAARERLSLALGELRHRMTPGSLVDQLSQSGAGEFFANFARDVRDNPLALAFFGASVALLMAPRIREAAASAFERGSEAASDLVQRAQSTSAAAGERVGGAAWNVSRAAGRTAATAAAVGEAATAGYRRTSRAASGFLALCREQPFMVIGIGIGVGAAIGAALAFGGQSDTAAPAAGPSDETQRYLAAEQARLPEEAPNPLLHPAGDEAAAVRPVSSVEAKEESGAAKLSSSFPSDLPSDFR